MLSKANALRLWVLCAAVWVQRIPAGTALDEEAISPGNWGKIAGVGIYRVESTVDSHRIAS